MAPDDAPEEVWESDDLKQSPDHELYQETMAAWCDRTIGSHITEQIFRPREVLFFMLEQPKHTAGNRDFPLQPIRSSHSVDAFEGISLTSAL